MNQPNNPLAEKSYAFALEIVRVFKFLKEEKN